jgi:AcrR family transcriptional regulator
VSKKTTIFKTAVRLFASQGYEATTTLQIAKEVGVTEPAVFYHFKSKNAFYSTVIEEAAKVYFERIGGLEINTPSAFASLEALIRIHFSIVNEEPDFMRILLRTCPARLEDPESKCTKVYEKTVSMLKTVLREILERGSASGEFVQVDIDATSNMLIAMFNGLMRQQIAGLADLNGVERGTINFCWNALVKKKGQRKEIKS